TQSRRSQFEDRPFRHIEHLLPPRDGRGTVKTDLLETIHEFGMFALFHDTQSAALPRHLDLPGAESAAKNEPSRALRDVHESADAGKTSCKTRHVDAALPIHFHRPENGEVESAAIVKIK